MGRTTTVSAKKLKSKKIPHKTTQKHTVALGESFMDSLRKSKAHYHYQSNSSQGDFTDIEAEYIEIKKVAVLQEEGNQAYWGAFAKQEMRGPLLLGEYFGSVRTVPKEGSKAEDKLTDHQFYNCFQLSNRKALEPAELEEFWPRKANCASCEQTANIAIQPYGNRVFYAIPRGVTIRQGEQLLPFYGEEYTFNSKVFLNPSDNDEESSTKLQNYPYVPRKVNLDRQLLTNLHISATTKFSKPSLEHLDIDTINLPLLAHDSKYKVLPQCEQENITLLHLACWMGGEEAAENIHALLEKGANPNQQTRKMGLSAVQAIVMSPHYANTSQKIACITQLQNAGAILMLQDRAEASVLHCAIKSEQMELARHLITLEHGLTALVNDDDQDFFLYAVTIASTTALDGLGPFITPRYLNDYIKHDEELDYLNRTLKKLHRTLPATKFEALEQTVMSICQEKRPDLYELLLKNFNPVESITSSLDF